MDKAVEICKDRMSRYGVTPNILIVPPSMLLYLSLAPEEKVPRMRFTPAAYRIQCQTRIRIHKHLNLFSMLLPVCLYRSASSRAATARSPTLSRARPALRRAASVAWLPSPRCPLRSLMVRTTRPPPPHHATTRPQTNIPSIRICRLQTRTRSRCCSARRRLASSTACTLRPSLTIP